MASTAHCGHPRHGEADLTHRGCRLLNFFLKKKIKTDDVDHTSSTDAIMATCAGPAACTDDLQRAIWWRYIKTVSCSGRKRSSIKRMMRRVANRVEVAFIGSPFLA